MAQYYMLEISDHTEIQFYFIYNIGTISCLNLRRENFDFKIVWTACSCLIKLNCEIMTEALFDCLVDYFSS